MDKEGTILLIRVLTEKIGEVNGSDIGKVKDYIALIKEIHAEGAPEPQRMGAG